MIFNNLYCNTYNNLFDILFDFSNYRQNKVKSIIGKMVSSYLLHLYEERQLIAEINLILKLSKRIPPI